MDMRRKWIWWTGGTLIALMIIGFATWNYAINYILNYMFTQSIGAELNVDGLLKQGPSEEPGNKGQTKPQQSTGNNTNLAEGNMDGGSGQTGTPGQNPDKPGTTNNPNQTQNPNSQPNESGSGKESGNNQGDSLSYDPNISVEKAKKVQDSITLKEKTKVTSVLLKRLSASDLSALTKMAGNGISVEEKKQIKKLLIEKLTEEEYNELIEIAQKYGLSQGKK